MRDILLSATAGFLFSCGGAFIVHRALWRSAYEHSRQLDSLAGKEGDVDSSTSTTRGQVSA